MPTFTDFIEGSNISIGHLRIVASAFNTLGIAGVINRALPKARQHYLAHGDIIKVMMLNSLGFVKRRLDLCPGFFSEIVIDRLPSDGVTNDHLNDNVLGRTFDMIATYGPTGLFNEVSAECLLVTDYGSTHCLHVDTPSLSASAASTAPTSTPANMTITTTIPKRPVGSQQFIIRTATDQHGIPL